MMMMCSLLLQSISSICKRSEALFDPDLRSRRFDKVGYQRVAAVARKLNKKQTTAVDVSFATAIFAVN